MASLSEYVGGGVATDFQEFTASGTWVKPEGAILVLVQLVGGGGGSDIRGSGGGGGEGVFYWFTPETFAATEAVIVGAGGGLEGNGGTSSIGSKIFARGGIGGPNQSAAGFRIPPLPGARVTSYMSHSTVETLLFPQAGYAGSFEDTGTRKGGNTIYGGGGGAGEGSGASGGISTLAGNGGSPSGPAEFPGGGGYNQGSGADGVVRIWSIVA